MTLNTISQWNYRTLHYTKCRKLLCLYASSTTEFSVCISVFCSIVFIQKTHKTSFSLSVTSFPTKTKINFLIYIVTLCVAVKDSIWFHSPRETITSLESGLHNTLRLWNKALRTGYFPVVKQEGKIENLSLYLGEESQSSRSPRHKLHFITVNLVQMCVCALLNRDSFKCVK